MSSSREPHDRPTTGPQSLSSHLPPWPPRGWEPKGPGEPQVQKLGKSLMGGVQRRTGGMGALQRGREVTSWNSGGEAVAQPSSAEVSLWVCVGGRGVPLKAPTQHHAKCNLRRKAPQQRRGGLASPQDVQSYLTSENFKEQGDLRSQVGLLRMASGHTRAHARRTHTPPAKFSLHVWKVKPGVSVSLLI